MNTKETLGGRITALENAVLCIVMDNAVKTVSPDQAALNFYHEMFKLATQRYIAAQPGPEKETMSRSLDATHRLFERLRDLLGPINDH